MTHYVGFKKLVRNVTMHYITQGFYAWTFTFSLRNKGYKWRPQKCWGAVLANVCPGFLTRWKSVQAGGQRDVFPSGDSNRGLCFLKAYWNRGLGAGPNYTVVFNKPFVLKVNGPIFGLHINCMVRMSASLSHSLFHGPHMHRVITILELL